MRILRAIIFCGRHGLPLRGHRDDDIPSGAEITNKGVFAGLLYFAVQSGDTRLADHLGKAPRNATYVSKNAQNDLLDCIKEYIQDVIVQEISNQEIGPKFAIMADEVTDVSDWEQLGLLVRYTRNNTLVERLLQFSKCKAIKGNDICETIVSSLKEVGLDPKNCRAQNYDGAGNMAGSKSGAAAQFNAIEGNDAPYLHCASHDLNLVLCHACKVPTILCMIENVRQLGKFFSFQREYAHWKITLKPIRNKNRKAMKRRKKKK